MYFKSVNATMTKHIWSFEETMGAKKKSKMQNSLLTLNKENKIFARTISTGKTTIDSRKAIAPRQIKNIPVMTF